MAEIVSLDPRYEGYASLYKTVIREPDGRESVREIEDHGVAATVLAYDPERRCALLVRLTRPPLLYRGDRRPMLEPIAGMVDRAETAEQAIRREAKEEAGLALRELEPVAHCFPSPGVSSETLALFLAPYGPGDRVGEGGGAEGEDEHIRVVERPLGELWTELEAGQLPDMKLILLLQALKLRRPELF